MRQRLDIQTEIEREKDEVEGGGGRQWSRWRQFDTELNFPFCEMHEDNPRLVHKDLLILLS